MCVSDDLPMGSTEREAGQQRVYRHKTWVLAQAAFAESAWLGGRSCMLILLTDRMRRALLLFLRFNKYLCACLGPARHFVSS